MITLQIILGLGTILIGLLVIKFSSFFSKILFIKAQPFYFKTSEETFGEKNSNKFVSYFGALFIILGIIVFLLGLLNIRIFN